MPGQILVIDPVAANRIVLRSRVTASCHSAVQADGPGEALARAAENRPDLILLGPGLAGEDACDMARRLAAAPASRGIPVLILTRSFSPDTVRDALLAGAEDALDPGAQEGFLQARIRCLLRHRGALDEFAARSLTEQQLGLGEDRAAFHRPATIALVTQQAVKGRAWRAALTPLLPHRLDWHAPQAVLTGSAEDGPGPELYVVEDSPEAPDDSLRFLAELRSRGATRTAAAILVGGPGPGGSESVARRMAMALDIGASDVMRHGFAVEELALRCTLQLARKRDGDRLRNRVQDGLREAMRDPLTGLYNRRYAMPHLDRIAARAVQTGRRFALMMVDLDRFKLVNDTYGHATGDQVLVETAARLAENVREQDLLARIGGEEFLIAMPETDLDNVRRAAARLRRVMADRPVAAGPERLAVTVSIGIAMADIPAFRAPGALQAPGLAMRALMEQADRALYRAKAQGRNTVKIGRSAA
ncbi:diguanylate cyclase [Poseidonocella sp. HB161398]|uniref:diguanylate cyclase n=1 Tax=Poseidonocella sp. HB161398 TaxID=2320855 RepID=UPI0011089FA6|nr:diguanylate cyclase [Poseidonocella sp. HB161398]